MQSWLRGAVLSIGRSTLQIVLPAWCVACETPLPWSGRTASCCAGCWSELPRISGAKCRSCARPLVDGTLCFSCQLDPLPLDWCEAWGEYRGSLEKVLQALKFRRHDFLDFELSGLLEERLRLRGDFDFDTVAGIPMTWVRERRRGYNQAELLARALGRRTGIRCDMTLLTRTGGRATQSTLPKRARAANASGAFAASSRVKDRSILLVDDISTTGETLRACANALRRAGAARVCAIAVAKAS